MSGREKGGRRARGLNDDERALWGNVTRSVAPLRRRVRSTDELSEGVARNEPQAAKASGASRPIPRPATAVTPPLAPLGRRLKQKIARGNEPIDARIDLHGMTQIEAHRALARFLHHAQSGGARIVLVITGKGKPADREPFAERGVLRRQVPLWLEGAEFRALVVGFEDAHIGHGGQGALYVRMRRQR